MKPPVEHVKITTKEKDALIKIKKITGLEHWNEVCRLALCFSLSNPAAPPKVAKVSDSAIDIEWRTFAGSMQQELSALILLKAVSHNINHNKKEDMADYFRYHMQRGILQLQNIKKGSALFTATTKD